MASPPMCANNCGFFGSAQSKNMCSKCYREAGLKQAQENLAKLVIVEKESDSEMASCVPPTAAATALPDSGARKNRCSSCSKKVGLTGFTCRCGSMFCPMHRYPDKHECTFNFKARGQDLIAKANPLVKSDKLDTRITEFVD